jgi:hypothetical protein
VRRDVNPIPEHEWRVEARRLMAEQPTLRHLPVVDERGRPVGIIDRVRFAAGDLSMEVPLRALASEPPAALARRAMARESAVRFDPVACCDEAGRYIGLIEIESLVDVLADQASESPD